MKYLSISILALIFMASCAKESLISETQSFKSEAALKGKVNGISEKFKVTIYNVAEDTPFPLPLSPGAWLVQKKNSAPLFEAGSPDFGLGLEAIAEDGMPGMLVGNLGNDPKVRAVGAFTTPNGADGPAPIFSGQSYSFYFTAKPNDYLNLATMFIQSNDLFIGPAQQGVPLFDEHGEAIEGDITMYMELWDAGTEVNEEPGVGPNQAPRQSGPNTGETENGNVRLVDDGFEYPELSEVVKVVIEVVY